MPVCSVCLGLILLACVPSCHLSENIAQGKPTAQSTDLSNTGVSRHAVDGDRNPNYFRSSCTHTTPDDVNPWWTVDLLDVFIIHQVVLYNRDTLQSRLDKVTVEGFLGDPFICTNGALCAYHPGPSGNVVTLTCPEDTRARYVRLSKPSGSALTLCEVEIFGEMTSYHGPPLCYQEKMKRIVGQKLTTPGDLGSVPYRVDCLHLCLRRRSCSVFSYNNVTYTCSSSVSPMNNNHITANHDTNLYAFC